MVVFSAVGKQSYNQIIGLWRNLCCVENRHWAAVLLGSNIFSSCSYTVQCSNTSLLKLFQRPNVCGYLRPVWLIFFVSRMEQSQLQHKLYSNHGHWITYRGYAYLHIYGTKHLRSVWTFCTNIFQVVWNKCAVTIFCDFSEFTCQFENLK